MSIVHLAFDIMVGASMVLLALSVWFAWLWWRHRRVPTNVWFLRCAALSGVVALVSLESGWVVTEVGRQPWTVVGLLLTQDAVTTHGNLWPFFGATVIIYATVGTGALLVLRALRRRWAAQGDDDVQVPYGPEVPVVSAASPESRTP